MSDFPDDKREVFKRVCEKVSMGIPLIQALTEDDDAPTYSTWYRWLDAHADLREEYTRAREMQADWDADQINMMAAQVRSGGLSPDQARVAIDAMKWSAAHRKPGVYGRRVDHHHQVEQIERIEMVLVKPPMRDITPEAKQIEAPDDPEI